MELLARVAHEPNVMGREPCIRGMRVTVGAIHGALAAGRTVPDVLADSPYLEEPDIRAALAYAAWRTQEADVEN